MPNFILDELMLQMGDAELRVLLCLVRLTCGYHRSCTESSLSALQKMSGLSRQGVINGINAGMKRGTITRTDGRRGGFVYELMFPSTSQPGGLVNEVDQSSQSNTLPLVNEMDYSTSQPSGLDDEIEPSTSQLSGLPLVNEVDRNTPVLKKVLKKGRLGRSLSTAEKRKKPTYPPTSQTPKLEGAQQFAFELLVDSEIGVLHRVATELASKVPAVDIYRAVDNWLPDHQTRDVGTGALVSRLKGFVENPRSINAPTVTLSAGFRDSDLFHRHMLPDEMIADGRKRYNIAPRQEPRKSYRP